MLINDLKTHELIHDVGIAIKYVAYEKLSKRSVDFLKSCPVHALLPMSHLFIVRAVIPFADKDASVIALAKELCLFDPKEFLILENYHNYSGMESGDYGAWFDNPFKLHKKPSSSLSYLGWTEKQNNDL